MNLRARWLSSGVLAVAVLLIYLIPVVRGRVLTETPEARVGVVAREMLANHEYLRPTMGGKERLIKPPLPYWLTALCAKTLSAGGEVTQSVLTRAVLIPPALATALAVFLVALFGQIFFGRAAGIISGLILGLCALVTYHAEVGYYDATLMCTCVGVFCGAAWLLCAPEPGLPAALAFGVSLGLGILTKWYVPVALVCLPLGAEMLLRRRFDRRRVALFVLGFAAAAVVASPWFILLGCQDASSLREIVNGIVISTEPMAHLPTHRWIYYPMKIAAGLMPWSPVLLLGWLVYFLKRGKLPEKSDGENASWDKGVVRFFALAFVLGFLAFYSQAKQQSYYLLPLYPLAALLSGYALSRFQKAEGEAERLLGRCLLGLGGVLGLLTMLGPVLLKLVVKSVPETLSLREFFESYGWPVCIAAALAAAGLCWHVAGQLRRGRVVRGALALSAPFFCGLCIWSWCAAAHDREREVLYHEASRIKPLLAAAGPDLRLYGVGPSDALMVYYIGRPVLSLKDLAAEPQNQTGAQAPRRMLMATPDGLKRGNLSGCFPEVAAQEQPLYLLELSPQTDWPKEIQARLSKRVKK